MVFAPLPEVTVNLSNVRCEPPYTIITHSCERNSSSNPPVNAHSSSKDSTLLGLGSEDGPGFPQTCSRASLTPASHHLVRCKAESAPDVH